MSITLLTSLTSLPVDAPAYVDDGGLQWCLWRFDDGAVIADTKEIPGAMLPPDVAAEIETVGAAISFARAAADRPTIAARISAVLLHGVVLSAPCYPRIEGAEHHATVGGHPDNGGGYACVVDPHGKVVRATVSVRRFGVSSEEEDRSPFEAARKFMEKVSPAGAIRALGRARARAGAAPERSEG